MERVRKSSKGGTVTGKNYVDHVLKYEVFDIKLTYNYYIFIPDVQLDSTEILLGQ